MSKQIAFWLDMIETIQKGKVPMNSNRLRPEPYFGKSMGKERQIAFCNKMIEGLTKP